MSINGRITFGVYPGDVRTVTSSAAFNDDQWHQVVGTLSPAGMELFVDGKRVGRRTDTTTAQPYSGVWRIGGDNLGGWSDQPSSNKFAGAIDEVSTYPTAPSLERVQAHFTASGRQLQTGVRPTDTYGSTVYDAQPDSYWRLSETTGTWPPTSPRTRRTGATSAAPCRGCRGCPGCRAPPLPTWWGRSARSAQLAVACSGAERRSAIEVTSGASAARMASTWVASRGIRASTENRMPNSA